MPGWPVCWMMPLIQQRAEGVEQRQMLSLQRGSFFRHRQRLRRHGEGEMTNNGANGVLMPVVDGKVGPAIRLQQRQLGEINFTRVVVAGGRLCWRRGRMAVA